MNNLRNGNITVVGNEKFTIPNTDFIISPLTTARELHMFDVVNGVEKDEKIADLEANQYTKVHGSVYNTIYYIKDNNEQLLIKF